MCSGDGDASLQQRKVYCAPSLEILQSARYGSVDYEGVHRRIILRVADRHGLTECNFGSLHYVMLAVPIRATSHESSQHNRSMAQSPQHPLLHCSLIEANGDEQPEGTIPTLQLVPCTNTQSCGSRRGEEHRKRRREGGQAQCAAHTIVTRIPVVNV